MVKAIFGLVNNEKKACKIVDQLTDAGFSTDDISVLYPNNLSKKTMSTDSPYNTRDMKKETSFMPGKKSGMTTEKHTKAPEGGVAGAAAGGVLGGSLGLLAGIGALAIPGVGPFIAAGPIMAALSGSAVGGSLGLLVGTLVGSGIPEYEAKKYEAGLKEGNILISVEVHDDDDYDKAHDILENTGATDISSKTVGKKSR